LAAPVEVHVRIDVYAPGPEPEDAPPWWQSIRIAYNAGLAFLAMPAGTAWARVLHALHQHDGLAGVWVIAATPLAVLAFADNAYRLDAAANPRRWSCKIRAAAARWLLWTTVIGTGLALPAVIIATATYILTGATP
jgi:hypothetical protein